MFVDMIHNGRAYGEVAEQVMGCNFDPGLLRPYLDNKNRKCVTVNVGTDGNGKKIFQKRLVSDLQAEGINLPIYNATSLRKEEWIEVDSKVVTAARKRLRAWNDLSAASPFRVNGMSTTMLEYEMMADIGEAVVDMDGISEGRSDMPRFTGQGTPLPITHSDFWYSARKLSASRRSGQGLDTISAEQAGRRVAEMVEKTLIGVETGITWGGKNSALTPYGNTSAVYGYTNFPQRLTKTNLTVPTGSNPEATVADVLAMRDQMYGANMFGPFMIYHSTNWDQYLDNDYARLGGNNASQTLRDRLRAIDDIQDVRRLDYLPPGTGTGVFIMIMVSMNSETARAVNGMDITTIQWETRGGMQLNFKVMCIMVPQLRADASGNCGILHATTP